jgi:hypothetical protein
MQTPWMASVALAMIRVAACEPHEPPRKIEKAPATEPAAPPVSAAKVVEIDPIARNANRIVTEGREIFRHDTFGSEAFWGGALRLHQAIAGSTHGGVGPGLSPKAALGVGLKVDVDKLPDSLVTALKASKVDLDDVGNTIALLQAVMRSSTSYRSMHGQLQSAVLRSSRRSCLRTCYATRPLCSYSSLGWIDR